MDFEALTFRDVTRTYGRRRALHRVSLSCAAGEVVALLGPNGAGKSTLLSIAATILEPSAGEVRFDGRTTRELGAALRARIGLLAHDLYLYPELSAAENLAFFARLYAVTDVAARVDRGLRAAGLTDRAGDAVAGFSRGMRQRLAIERALVHDPRLVLLDEPFTGLDDVSATALKRRLETLRASGRIVLLTTHDLEAVESIVDRAILLSQGRVVPVESGPEPLRTRYRRAFATA